MSTEEKDAEATFSGLLGEYLDTVALLYSEIATTTEKFIRDCEELKFTTAHPADEARRKYIRDILSREPPQTHEKQDKNSDEKKEKKAKDSETKKEKKDETKKHKTSDNKEEKDDTDDEENKSSQQGEHKKRRRKHRKPSDEQPA